METYGFLIFTDPDNSLEVDILLVESCRTFCSAHWKILLILVFLNF